MSKLVVISFLTLDGVMQAPGDSAEDTAGGFRYGGWQVPFFPDVNEVLPGELGNVGALLLGRKTYDIFAAYWPTAGKDIEPYGPFMNNITKYVASRTLRQTAWQNSVLLQGEAAAAVARLKAEAGRDLYVFGSGDLAQTLMREHLVDEYLLLLHPLVLGAGKRLFQADGPRQELVLVHSTTTQQGVLVLRYQARRGAQDAS